MKKLFVILFLFFPMLGMANLDTDYSVLNLRITKTDRDATTAREKAMLQAQRDAFNIILNRLNIDYTHNVVVSDGEISQMLRSMQIKNEKITNKSYSATITMEFSPEYVKYILNKYKLSKFLPKLNTYLVVPLLNEDNTKYLFDKKNRFIPSFKKYTKNSKNIFIIEDEDSTKNLINVNDFKDLTFSKFKEIADLYNVNNVLIVIANLEKNKNIIETKFYILNQEKSKVAGLNYEIKNLKNINLDFNEITKKIIEYINDLNTTEALENDDENFDLQDGKIYVFVPVSSISEYENINNVLNANKNIKNLYLKMLSKNMVIYSTSFINNDLKSLINSLKNDGFSVNEKKNGLYLFYKN